MHSGTGGLSELTDSKRKESGYVRKTIYVIFIFAPFILKYT